MAAITFNAAHQKVHSREQLKTALAAFREILDAFVSNRMRRAAAEPPPGAGRSVAISTRIKGVLTGAPIPPGSTLPPHNRGRRHGGVLGGSTGGQEGEHIHPGQNTTFCGRRVEKADPLNLRVYAR